MSSLAPSVASIAPWLSSLSRHAASSAVAGIWEGTLLAIAVALFLRLTPNVTARIRFLLWTITFALLAVLPFLHPASGSSDSSAPASILSFGIGWSFAVAALWLAASTFRLAAMLRETHRLRQIWKRAQPLSGESSMRVVGRIGRRPVQLCLSSQVDRPSVIGFIAPRILIPSWLLSRITPAELDQIVLHELEHLRRRDDWSNLLQKLSLALFPLNPALLWIESRLCLEREMACDEGVLAKTSSPHAYATCLTNLAEHSLYRRAGALSLAAVARKSQLARRVHSILSRPAAMRPWQQAALSGTVVFSLVAAAAGLARCPQLVSFNAQPSPAQFTLAFGGPAPLTGTPGARMVSLKAEMPSATPSVHLSKTTPAAPVTLRRAAHHPATQTTSTPAVFQPRSQSRPPDHSAWLVLTSYDAADTSFDDPVSPSPAGPPIVVTVFRYSSFSSSFAAVPTGSGWLVIQL